jgi:hypothetical protein
VLLCNQDTVSETRLMAPRIGDYLKQNFHKIREYQGIEDSKSGICLIVSVITSSDWAFEVQDSYSMSPLALEFNPKISFKYSEPSTHSQRWGSWLGTLGHVGPRRSSSDLYQDDRVLIGIPSRSFKSSEWERRGRATTRNARCCDEEVESSVKVLSRR